MIIIGAAAGGSKKGSHLVRRTIKQVVALGDAGYFILQREVYASPISN